MVEGSRTVVFSSSITRGIDFDRFKDRYTGGKIRFQKFPGGKAEHMSDYMPTHLFKENPDTVIIHVGGNDLPTPRHDPVPVSTIVDHIIECGRVCRSFEVENVLIAGVTIRKASYMQKRCRDLNYSLRGMCSANGFKFIDNSGIKEEHLSDGVHLNEAGTSILSNNYLNALWDVHNK